MADQNQKLPVCGDQIIELRVVWISACALNQHVTFRPGKRIWETKKKPFLSKCTAAICHKLWQIYSGWVFLLCSHSSCSFSRLKPATHSFMFVSFVHLKRYGRSALLWLSPFNKTVSGVEAIFAVSWENRMSSLCPCRSAETHVLTFSVMWRSEMHVFVFRPCLKGFYKN